MISVEIVENSTVTRQFVVSGDTIEGDAVLPPYLNHLLVQDDRETIESKLEYEAGTMSNNLGLANSGTGIRVREVEGDRQDSTKKRIWVKNPKVKGGGYYQTREVSQESPKGQGLGKGILLGGTALAAGAAAAVALRHRQKQQVQSPIASIPMNPPQQGGINKALVGGAVAGAIGVGGATAIVAKRREQSEGNAKAVFAQAAESGEVKASQLQPNGENKIFVYSEGFNSRAKTPERDEVENSVNHAVDVIASVHSLGDDSKVTRHGSLFVNPQLILESDRQRQGVGGEMAYDPRLEKVYITTGQKEGKNEIKNAELMFIHEMGHALDYQIFGKNGEYGTTNGTYKEKEVITGDHKGHRTDNSDVLAVLDVIKNSEAVKKLQDNRGLPIPIINPGHKYADYLLLNEELWARAYTQWIATESGDTRIKEQLNNVRSHALERKYPSHWDDADFEPIRTALNDLAVKRGWRTHAANR